MPRSNVTVQIEFSFEINASDSEIERAALEAAKEKAGTLANDIVDWYVYIKGDNC